MATATVLSVPLPAQGSIVEIFTGHNQSFIRDIQKDLVPRCIAYSGYRWHNSLCRPEMLQILRHVTMLKEGVYIHWDALNARSEKGTDAKALGVKIAASHAHATRMHKGYVRETVAKLFRDTPNDEKLCFVKEEVFGIKNGAPIISPDHPVMREMFEQPITGALCCFPWNFVVKYPDRCAGLVGNYKSKVLFEKADSDENGETTLLKNP